MGKVRHVSSKMFNIGWLKKALPWLLIVLLLLSQIERFVHEGTLLGYEVRNTKRHSQIKKQKAQSGKITDTRKLPDGKDNKACKVLNAEEVASVRPVKFIQNGGLTPDSKSPLISTCIYSFKGDKGGFEMITLLLREKASSDAAKKVIGNLQKSKQGQEIANIGDAAYFNGDTNQLTVVKGSTIYTLTFSSSEKSLNSKDITTNLAKQL